MNDQKIISYIEDESFNDINNCYYHAFLYQQSNFINMITKGIKAPILRGKKGEGSNGNFYVCLSKKEECDMSIYDKLSINPMFIINGKIMTIKSLNFRKYGHYIINFTETPFPFRECEYDNEYQKFLKVSPKDIIAIQYNLFSNSKKYNNDYNKYQLFILKHMIEDLKNQKIYLPIIDGSTCQKINQEKVLSLKI